MQVNGVCSTHSLSSSLLYSFQTSSQKQLESYHLQLHLAQNTSAVMSVPITRPPQTHNTLPLNEAIAASGPSSSSSTWNNNNSMLNPYDSLLPFPPHKTSKLEDSDEDLFTVPDVEVLPSIHSGPTIQNSNLKQSNVADPQFRGQRRRGRNPADKEYRRLKRLLRNRVSAQQARERKKVYVNDLELKAKELQENNSHLEERISTLTNENNMLRKILMNTRPKVDEGTEPKQDQFGKS